MPEMHQVPRSDDDGESAVGARDVLETARTDAEAARTTRTWGGPRPVEQ